MRKQIRGALSGGQAMVILLGGTMPAELRRVKLTDRSVVSVAPVVVGRRCGRAAIGAPRRRTARTRCRRPRVSFGAARGATAQQIKRGRQRKFEELSDRFAIQKIDFSGSLIAISATGPNKFAGQHFLRLDVSQTQSGIPYRAVAVFRHICVTQ